MKVILHFIASQEGNLKILEYLILHSANIECKTKDGFTPLHIASKEGHFGIVEYLISQGVFLSDATPFYIYPHQIIDNSKILGKSTFMFHKNFVTKK